MRVCAYVCVCRECGFGAKAVLLLVGFVGGGWICGWLVGWLVGCGNDPHTPYAYDLLLLLPVEGEKGVVSSNP